MLFSSVVMLAIMVSTATTLHAHGVHDLSGAAQAGTALEPVTGAAVLALLG
jgi:Mn2+/Fe2+ NRAMP family transporter